MVQLSENFTQTTCSRLNSPLCPLSHLEASHAHQNATYPTCKANHTTWRCQKISTAEHHSFSPLRERGFSFFVAVMSGKTHSTGKKNTLEKSPQEPRVISGDWTPMWHAANAVSAVDPPRQPTRAHYYPWSTPTDGGLLLHSFILIQSCILQYVTRMG